MLKQILFPIIILLTFVFNAVYSFGQETEILVDPNADIEDTTVYKIFEIPAKAPYDFQEFVLNNIKYPTQAREEGISANVKVEFIVEKDGSITNINVLNGKKIGYGLPEEAIRIYKMAPKWTPAYIDGHPVKSMYTQPINFSLHKN